MAKTLAKHVTASPAVNASRAPQKAKMILIGSRGEKRGAKDGLQRQPFADKSVKRRQGRDRQHADQEEAARPRHATRNTAKPIEIPRAGSGLHRASAYEQESLINRVVREVIERCDERNAGDDPMAAREEHHGSANARRDDAHVLDRAVGKKTLHLGLDRRVENPDQRGNAAGHEHDQPETRRGHRYEVEVEANDPVDSEIDDHRGQQGGNIGRGDGMGERQPAVDRHEPSLHREAEEGKQENGSSGPLPERRRHRPQPGEFEASCALATRRKAITTAMVPASLIASMTKPACELSSRSYS